MATYRVNIGYETEVLQAFTSQHPPINNSPFLKVNLIFSFKSLINIWTCEEDSDSQPSLLMEIEHPMRQTDLSVDLTRYEHTLTLVKEKTKDWPIADQALRDMLDKAQQVVESIQVVHNRATVEIRVIRTVEITRFDIRVGRYDEGMIPACESAIESLATVEGREGSCCICMVEFSKGALMPCQHVFHRDCITKWLRISKFCPLCRYEMKPTFDL